MMVGVKPSNRFQTSLKVTAGNVLGCGSETDQLSACVCIKQHLLLMSVELNGSLYDKYTHGRCI